MKPMICNPVFLMMFFCAVFTKDFGNSAPTDDNNPPPGASPPACARGTKCKKPTPGYWACNYCNKQKGTVTLKKPLPSPQGWSYTRIFIFPNFCQKCLDAACYCKSAAKKYGLTGASVGISYGLPPVGKLWEPEDLNEYNWVKANAPNHFNADKPKFRSGCHWWIGATNTPADGNNMRYYSTNNNGPLAMSETGVKEDCVDIYPGWRLGDHPHTWSLKFICQVDVRKRTKPNWFDISAGYMGSKI